MITAWKQMSRSSERVTAANAISIPTTRRKGLTHAARYKGTCKCHKAELPKQEAKQGLQCISACKERSESAYHSHRREEPCTSVMTMLTSLEISPNCSAKPSFRVPGGCLCQSSLNINLMAMNAWLLIPCSHSA